MNERFRNHPTENFEYEDERIENTQETDMPTQLLRMQKNQLIDLKQNLESYVNLLHVFGFNSGKFDLNLTMSYLISHLINDIEAEPLVIKRLTVCILQIWRPTLSFRFWVEQHLQTTFLKPIDQVRQKSFLTSGLTVRKSSRIKNYLHT